MDSSNQAGWWKPLAIHRGSLYVAFNGNRWGGMHTVRVARRLPNEWREDCLRMPWQRHRCALYPDDSGHNQPTIAVDGAGLVHVFASMHHRRWQYWRSEHPGWVKTMRFRGWELGRKPGRFTYPVAASGPDGDAWLIVRQSGVQPVLGRLYHWSVAERRWHSRGVFAAAAGHGVYPDDLHVGPDGRVHILWSWSGGPAAGIKHAASYMVYDPASRTYANAPGEPVAVPATPNSAVVLQPLEPGEEWTHVMTGYGQRGAKLSLNPETGWPVVAYRYAAPADGGTLPIADDAKVRLAAWNGSVWELTVAYEPRTSEALGLSHHDGEPRLYVADPGTLSGTLAVLQADGADYVYHAAPHERALYIGLLPGSG
jgi:hypothetical protein